MTTENLAPAPKKKLLWKPTGNRARWSRSDMLIEQWLMGRQELLVSFNRVAQCEPFQENPFKKETLLHFCQILIDYLSVGHFQILETLAKAKESCHSSSELDKKLLDKILSTTLVGLSFNDKHAEADHLEELLPDLSNLGVQLAHRMEYEDILVHQYLTLTGSPHPKSGFLQVV